MTYNEALEFSDRIEEFVIGTVVEGWLIEDLMIAPTLWGDMREFMNLRLHKGGEVAGIQFSEQGRSLSVYGISRICLTGETSQLSITNLDDWEMAFNN